MDIDTIDFTSPAIYYLITTGIITTAIYFILGKPPIIECIIAGGIIMMGFNQLVFRKY